MSFFPNFWLRTQPTETKCFALPRFGRLSPPSLGWLEVKGLKPRLFGKVRFCSFKPAPAQRMGVAAYLARFALLFCCALLLFFRPFFLKRKKILVLKVFCRVAAVLVCARVRMGHGAEECCWWN